jgi:pimeloyl-ACP methyl ester carboxylesterase
MRRCTGLRAYLPNAEFKIIKGSCHLIPIDEPHELAKEIASFMGGLLLSRNNA